MLEHYIETILSSKFDNVSTTFFHRPGSSKTLSLAHSFRMLTLRPRPSNYLNKSLGRKTINGETLYREYLSSTFDNVPTTFFIDQIVQKYFRFHTLFGFWHTILGA